MIVITGAAGFIGSCLAGKLNNRGFTDLVLVDDFSRTEKEPNTVQKSFLAKVDRDRFFDWFEHHTGEITFVFHIGARTDTTEFDMSVFDRLNLSYTKKVWELCARHGIPMVYASSAATYGDGTLGYDDADPALSELLKPLNPYGISKNEFDKWALQQTVAPPRWYGLKFFNVFGPNEYHKGRMASVVFHSFNQITSQPGGKVRLFRSHNPAYRDGEQLRDFVYVKDVTNVMYFLMEHSAPSGLYNLGTGKARTFLDLVHSVYSALNLEPAVEFIDTPEDIRDKYQYFTEAKMEKLRAAGYTTPFRTLEESVAEYVQGYLADGMRF